MEEVIDFMLTSKLQKQNPETVLISFKPFYLRKYLNDEYEKNKTVFLKF